MEPLEGNNKLSSEELFIKVWGRLRKPLRGRGVSGAAAAGSPSVPH